MAVLILMKLCEAMGLDSWHDVCWRGVVAAGREPSSMVFLITKTKYVVQKAREKKSKSVEGAIRLTFGTGDHFGCRGDFKDGDVSWATYTQTPYIPSCFFPDGAGKGCKEEGLRFDQQETDFPKENRKEGIHRESPESKEWREFLGVESLKGLRCDRVTEHSDIFLCFWELEVELVPWHNVDDGGAFARQSTSWP